MFDCRHLSVPTIALAMMLACGSTARAQNQPAGPPESSPESLCDKLAAHRWDRDRPAAVVGVADIAASDIRPAVAACGAATGKPGAHRRMWFQLGRALEFDRRAKDAIPAYRRAVEAGSTIAMVGLGALLATGTDGAPNPAEAKRLFEAAAATGDVYAMSNLGAAYGSGLDGPVDMVSARAWYLKAADAGDEEAFFQLGLMSRDGDGGPKDEAAAKTWLQKAAAADHAGALTALGEFAEKGIAGPKDEKLALSYYERAVRLGDDDAREPLRRLRCPFELKDKDGRTAGLICFDGNR